MALHSLDQAVESESQETHWIPLSDLMTGLMVIFLLIAVMYMLKVEGDADRIRRVAIAYHEIRDALFIDLHDEFQRDLVPWKAEILRNDLTIRFNEPEILFANGSSELKPEFKAILADFFPRYVRILTAPRYRDSISEIRIEGHTSSLWTLQTSPEDAYARNMELSQARTRTTLNYLLALPSVAVNRPWLTRYLTANGLSSSRPILDAQHNEDPERSRRVEFRVRTDAENRIAKILEYTQ
jgi:outer membrane protein OmpA-like peptidoglycan-associated protein